MGRRRLQKTGNLYKQGYSPATLSHIRATCSAIFTLAKRKQWLTGDNPAQNVRVPEIELFKELHALTMAQAKAVLAAMAYPEFQMTLISILTSMNIAEICGLQWKRLPFLRLPGAAEGIPRSRWSAAGRDAAEQVL